MHEVTFYEYINVSPPPPPPPPPITTTITATTITTTATTNTRMDTLTKEICKPLGDILRAYKVELRRLHPFEATLADLTVKARAKQGYLTLEQVLHTYIHTYIDT